MDLTNISKRCVMWTFMIIVLVPNGANSEFVSSFLEKVDSVGLYLEVYSTQTEAVSCGACALNCVRTKSATPMCQGFSCDLLDRTCNFYTKGTSPLTASGYEIFIFTDSFHDVPINGKLFSVYLSPERKIYSDARTHCHDKGGYLLQFDSLDEYAALQTLVLSGNVDEQFWIGANDIDDEGVWVTDREKTSIDSSTWLWCPGEPNNSINEDCGAIVQHSWRMNDSPCTYTYRFFCEKDR